MSVLFIDSNVKLDAAGATMYAQSPSTVYARRSRFAYGVRCSTEWRDGLPQNLKFFESSTNTVLCMECFSAMVEYDELVEHDQVAMRPHHVKMHCHLTWHQHLSCLNKTVQGADLL